MSFKSILWFLVTAVIALVVLLIVVAILFLVNDATLSDFFDNLLAILRQLTANPIFWVLLCVPYFLIKLVRYWIMSYRRGGWRQMTKRILYTAVLPAMVIILFMQLIIAHQNSEDFKYFWDASAYNQKDTSHELHRIDQKVRGMHVFGGLDSLNLAKLVKAHVEHVVLVPYAYQEDFNSTAIRFNRDRAIRRDAAYASIIARCRAKKVHVIVKPHIWMTNPSDGKWRADIEMADEAAWLEWEKNYTAFILHYARFSQKHRLPIFCIGNEYYLSTTRRPAFWSSLIEKVRAIYSGKLTYGANWDSEFAEITFWNELDYIGIQAYFPLAAGLNPDYTEIALTWDKHLSLIKTVSDKHERPTMFTELGYKSTEDAAQYPWGWEDHFGNMVQPISEETQTYCYQAFFDRVWFQEWFAGVMIWQWQSGSGDDGPNHNFTPENKPAYNEMAKGFSKTTR